ncbi:uncharacterized protein Pyn_39710 [Prunus yedoensis var. nudiflora]|uniref:Pre-mRNA-processing factor 39 n=1 Tax=Prunus yedoensis var. nudiflora TaxID=2094558 RepID=A0A314UKH6_PRUYE|nr:uncharacterized protein Pyn_39710 [Prunus yedoensis var. nudiflora]
MRTCNCESEPEPMESDSPDDFRRDSLDFDHWTSLISEIETAYSDDVEKISSVYDSFLSEFPLCHGYWRRYADHKARLCSVDKVVHVFERAVQSATYSVPLWVDYCNFAMAAFEDPSDIRRLFQRGMSFVGKDYSCHTLWDKYIEFEYSQQQGVRWPRFTSKLLDFLPKSCIVFMKVEPFRCCSYKAWFHVFFSLKKFAASCEEEMKCQSSFTVDLQSETVLDSEAPTFYRDDEIALVAKDLLDPAIGLESLKHCKNTYMSESSCIRKHLENWHHYLDFVEIQGDFDWAVKLYERCLIPCANYPEFWMRYVEFMEINGGREIANYALDRATQIFMKRLSVIHLFNARFKEKIGDDIWCPCCFS